MAVNEDYDVVVLGGGTAGSMAARTAASAGARTVMFNDGELGGLCILRGCMPTKTMLHAAHLLHDARHHRTFGVGTADLGFDFAAVMANKDRKVERFKRAKIAGIETGGYDVIDARARFTGPDTVEAGGVTYRFSRGAVLATGSVPHRPHIAGVDEVDYLTSDEVMQLREKPASAIVLGSGAIGLELAQFFARLGTPVQLVTRRPVLTDVGPEFTAEMQRVLADEPDFELVTAPPIAARQADGGVQLDVAIGEQTRTLRAQVLILATGREPALDGIGLDAAGIEVAAGDVVSGPDLRTTNARVFVAGDATGDRQILHVANWEGRVAGLGAAQVEGSHEVERRLDMEVVFTDPPLATLGLTAAAAQAAGHDVITAQAAFQETGRAITQDVAHGLWKIVADRRGEILGSQILGPRADDLVHTVAAVMYYRGTAAQLLEMPWYHPTLTEVLLGLARDLDRQVTG